MPRAKKPTALRVLEGNKSKRPLPTNEPAPTLGEPPMPDWLDTEAREEWRRLVKVLTKIRVLTEADGTALAQLCRLHSEIRHCYESIDEFGRFIESLKGHAMPNPAYSMVRDLFPQYKSLMQEFGLTPASRSKLEALPPEKEETKSDPIAAAKAKWVK